jgi:2-methylaconitate cis-trans-isomerase PrpF
MVVATEVEGLHSIDTLMMRGGTSKGLFVAADDLPSDPDQRDQTVLGLLGAADPLQVDGLGGGNPSTSKLIAVERARTEGIALEYLYAAVTPGSQRVAYDGNCGNLTAAVAMYGFLSGLIESTEDVATVMLRNRNTGIRVRVRQPMVNGSPAVVGSYAVDGISRTGAEIVTTYLDPAGSVLGALLPTRRSVDELVVDGQGSTTVSIVDVTSPYVFVDAADFGLAGFETPEQLNADASLRAAMERVRAHAAVHLGLVETADEAATGSPGLPRLALVARPRPPATAPGDSSHLVVRAFAGGRIHHALSVTGAMCAAAAALLPGTVVADAACEVRADDPVRVEHPKGVTEVAVDLVDDGTGTRVAGTSVSRTARPLLHGKAFV